MFRKMPKNFISYLLLLFCFSINSYSQYGRYYHEVGVSVGPVFFRSDYGARDDFKNFINNNGISLSVNYYFTPNVNYESINEHFKLRCDLNVMKVDLQHYGEWVETNKYSLFREQLRAMKAKLSEIALGSQIEYYPFKTDDYIRGGTFTPYIGLGVQANYYSVVTSSSLGSINTSISTPNKYRGAIESKNAIVASVSYALGTRIRMSDYNFVSLELSSKYYFSDYVDGMNPDRKVYTENKSNDWLNAFHVGYIYYFN